MRVRVGEFNTHFAQQVGSMSVASKNKQADIFSSARSKVGWLTQYGLNSYSVRLSEDYARSMRVSSLTTHTSGMQVRRFLEQLVPDGQVEWR